MKRNLSTRIFILLLVALFMFTSCSKNKRKIYKDGKTPVERYGALHVEGTYVCGENGKPVQLCGMSSNGLQWDGKYANKDVIKWLRDDWNIDLWRAAMYLGQGGYASNRFVGTRMIDSIEAAIELGVYVLVDWHVIPERDPLIYADLAEEFFEKIASTYANVPNIIYEICNEPNGNDITWEDNVKPYAERIIPIIRKYCDNIIVVGTPRWSSDLYSVIEDPITGEKNIMYTLHFYAGSHGEDYRERIVEANNNGLAVFVTEWGTSEASGDGGPYFEESKIWLDFMAERKLCWANWSITNKGESSGALKFNKDRDGKGGWTEKDLQPSGIFVRKYLRGESIDQMVKDSKK